MRRSARKFALFSSFIFLLSFGSYCSAGGIYPKAADNLKQMELGDAVYMLMPNKGADFYSWSSGADIAWITDSIGSYADGDSYRLGLMRVNVMGVKSTILRKYPEELAWSVIYQGVSNPRFGVQSITLEPGVEDGKANCFGASATSCTFNPLMSLAHAGITVEVLCEADRIDGKVVGVALSARGKRTIQASWSTSGGSGGSSTSMTLFLSDKDQGLCQ